MTTTRMGETDTSCETDWRNHPYASLYAPAILSETPKEPTTDEERQPKHVETEPKQVEPEPDKAPPSSEYCIIADSSNNSTVSSIDEPYFVTDSSETASQDVETEIVRAVLNLVTQKSDTSVSRCLRLERKRRKRIGDCGSRIVAIAGTPPSKRLKSSLASPMIRPPPALVPNSALNPIVVSRLTGTRWNKKKFALPTSTTRRNPKQRRNAAKTKQTIVPFVANKWWAKK